jgi:hypothetical protein
MCFHVLCYFQSVTLTYAQYLSAKNYHEDAALAFQVVGRHLDAASCWEKALKWQPCMAALLAANVSSAEMTSAARRLATQLRRDGRGTAAAALLCHHADDEEEAVSALAECGGWDEAERLVATTNRRDLYGNVMTNE